MKRTIVTAISAASAMLISFSACAVQNYVATPLGTLGGSFGSNAVGVNSVGAVAGFSFTTGNAAMHAFRYSGGAILDLGTLGGTNSRGTAINAAGNVVGLSDLSANPNPNQHAFLYSAGVMVDLGTLPGGASSTAYGINTSGQIVGASSYAGSGATHAFLLSGGGMTDLGTFGGAQSTAQGINDNGRVTGDAETASGAFHAFLYSGGSMLDLGTLGGASSSGVAINIHGQVAGLSETASGPIHGFLYSNGVMIDLGALPGGTGGTAYGIDSSGQVVGAADVVGQTLPQAFLYSGGTMYDLNALVVSGLSAMTLVIASSINDSGQIAATGCDASGICQAFRLDPVTIGASSPVPALSQWALIIVSLLIIAIALRLRHR